MVAEAATVKDTGTARIMKRLSLVRSEEANWLDDYRNIAGRIENGMVEILHAIGTVANDILALNDTIYGAPYF